MNYKNIIKIFYFFFIFFLNYKSVYLNNFLLFSNYFLFLNNLFFFKKNNSSFKKINNLNNPFNLLQKKNSNLIFLRKKIFKNKYFIFFNEVNSQQFMNNSNLKLIDLKKKFILNLFDFKHSFNKLLNSKKLKKKSLFKNFNLFFLYFKKNNFFFEYSLVHLLIKLKFIFNYSDYVFLNSNNNIFLNRNNLLKNKMINLYKGDIVEFTISNYFYLYLSKINNYFNIIKLKKKNKQYLNFFFFDLFNKSKNCESSFKSNSLIFINNLINYRFVSNYFNFFINYYLIKLYKWKN